MRPLRICMVTTFYPPYNLGGDGIGVQRLTHALARRGHEVTVVHDADAYEALAGAPPPGPVDEPPGVHVVSLRSGVGMLSAIATHQTGRPVFNRRRLKDLLDGGGFDLVNFHNISLVGGPGVLSYGGSAVRMYMAHEHWLVCPTHVLWRHDREPCPGRQCVRCTLRSRRPLQLWRHTGGLERQLKHVDVFVAMSDFSRRKHHEFGFPREMEVLPCFLPDANGTGSAGPAGESPHGHPYFLFAGRLEKIKGLHDVIPLFADPEGPDLLVAGAGGHDADLRRMARDLPRVRFLGRVGSDELARLYEHALALLVPSVCWETFGITVIEAFRYGLPVIARDRGPLPEIVAESNGGGRTFRSREELRGILAELERDRELRHRMGQAGREAFASNWAESVVIPRYLEIVRRAAERGGRARVSKALAA